MECGSPLAAATESAPEVDTAHSAVAEKQVEARSPTRRMVALLAGAVALVVASAVGVVLLIDGQDSQGSTKADMGATPSTDDPNAAAGAPTPGTPDWTAHGWWSLDCIDPAVPEPGDPPSGHVSVSASTHFPSGNPDYELWVVAASCYPDGNSQLNLFSVLDSTGQVESKQVLMHPTNDEAIVHVTEIVHVVEESSNGEIHVRGTIKDPYNDDAPSEQFDDVYYDGAKAWGRASHEVTPVDGAPPSGLSGAVGYGDVTIGMSLDDLLASGEIEFSDYDDPGCADRGDCDAPCETYRLDAGGQVDMAYEGNVVGQIVFGGDMATSKGIKVGSTEEDLLDAYPAATVHRTPYPEVTEYVVPMRSGVHYFAFVSNGQVSNLLMSRESAICIE